MGGRSAGAARRILLTGRLLPGRSGGAAEELGAALDLIARMVRVMDEVPVLPDDPAAGELRAEWESWARHILTLSPPPGSETATRQRGWGPLAQFLTQRRRREQEQVAAGFAHLRGAVLKHRRSGAGDTGQ